LAGKYITYWAFIGMGILGVCFPLFYSRFSSCFPDWERLSMHFFVFLQIGLGSITWFMGRLFDLKGGEFGYWLPMVCIGTSSALTVLSMYYERHFILTARKKDEGPVISLSAEEGRG
ncbi:MAG: hypothetical protein HQK54_15495, partial [Oligoflexales bacterium]|nr:hypothetical protein [Oligoflexales bacterium]